MAENSAEVDSASEAVAIFAFYRPQLQKLLTGMSVVEFLKVIKEEENEKKYSENTEDQDELGSSCFVCEMKKYAAKDLWKNLCSSNPSASDKNKQSSLAINALTNGLGLSLFVENLLGGDSSHGSDLKQVLQETSQREKSKEQEAFETKIKHLFVEVAENLLAFVVDGCSSEGSQTQHPSDTFTFVTSTSLSPDYIQSNSWLAKFCIGFGSPDKNVVEFKACRKCMDLISFVSAETEENQQRPINASELLNHVITMLYVCASELDDGAEGDSVCSENGVSALAPEAEECDALPNLSGKVAGEFVTMDVVKPELEHGEYTLDSLAEEKSCIVQVAVNGHGEEISLDVHQNQLTDSKCGTYVNGTTHSLSNGEVEFMSCESFHVQNFAEKKSGPCLKKLTWRSNSSERTLLPNGGHFRWVKSVNVAKVKPGDLVTSKTSFRPDRNGVFIDVTPTKLHLNGNHTAEPDFKADENMPRVAKSKCKDIINLLVNTNELAADPTSSPSPSKQGKPRTPSKKRCDANKRNASMRKVVVGYLTTPSCDFGTVRTPPARRNKGRRPAGPKSHSSKKKAIPIPYETHYLCITQTLAKKGWKAYWYRKCRCAKSRRSTASMNTVSPVCSDEESAYNDTSAPLSPFHCKETDLSSSSNPVSNNPETSSSGAIEVVITTNTEDLMKTTDLESSLESTSCEIEPEIQNQNTREVTSHDELLQMDIKQELDMSSKHFTENTTCRPHFVRDVTEMKNRRRKLDEALNTLKELRKLRSRETCDIMMQPVVFAQSLEAVDKQPSVLDLVSVEQSTVAKCVDSKRVKVEDIFAEKSARSAGLLKGNTPSALARSLSAKCDGHPYFGSVWNYGKTSKFFEEARNAKPLGKFKKLKPRFRVTKPSALGMHRLKSLKRAMMHKKPKLVHLLKPRKVETIPVANDHFNQLLEPDLWKVPRQSISAIVCNLEYLWGEEPQPNTTLPPTKLFTPKSRKPYGAISISDRQIEHALGALCKDDDIFTFSSKRLTSGGQKNVLLISRKYLTEPRLRRRRYRKDSFNGECPCMQMKPFDFEELETPSDDVLATSNESPNKILLKLKKVHNSCEAESVTYSTDNIEANKSIEEGIKPLVNCDTSGENAKPDTHKEEQVTVVDASVNNNVTVNDIAQEEIVEPLLPTPTKTPILMPLPALDVSGDLQKGADNIDNEDDNAPAQPETPQLEPIPHNCVSRDRTSSDEWATPPSSPLDIITAGSSSHISTPSTFPPSTLLDTSTPLTNNPAPDKGKINLQLKDGFSERPSEIAAAYEDELHQFLSNLNGSSLELLESVLLWCDPEQPPPLQLLISLQEVHNETTEESRAQLRTYGDSPARLSPFHTTERGFLSFDSPEVIRGVNRSKHSSEELPPAPMSPTESETNFRGSPMSPGCMENQVENCIGNPDTLQLNGSTVMKSCNVVLEPIDSLCLTSTSANISTKGATDFHRRLYAKILKNHALNGAYWRSPALTTDDAEKSRPLRDRRKRKRSEEEVEDEEESDEESDADSDDESAVLAPSGPKRKRRGRTEYTRIADQQIEGMFKRLWSESSEETQPVDKEEETPKEGDSTLRDFFKFIMSRGLDLKQIKSWMLKSSATNPIPLLFPRLVAKRNRLKQAQEKVRTKSRSRRGSSVISSSSTVTSYGDDGKGRKRKFANGMRKRSKDFATPSTSGTASGKPICDDEFEEIRKQLFQLRHPEYSGKLCGTNESFGSLPPIPVRSAPIQLHHVSEDEAKKSDEPVLDKKAIVHGSGANGKGFESGEFFVPPKRRRVFSPCRTPPHDSHQNDVIHPQPSPFPVPSHSSGLTAPSRGRGRGRGRGRISKLLRRRVESESSEQDQRGPRLNSRFANKHSTEGAFLQKILESGDFENYV